MCAILGVSFAPGSELNRHKLASALLSAAEVRGRDASGFAAVSPSVGEVLYKKDLPGSKLHVGRLPADASAMILHTRASTHGSPRDMENNHPIESPSGAIRLVHNGVIYNHEEIRTLLGKVGKGLPEVDSSVIPAIIEEFGLDATSELGGYASAAWFDRETDDTIHLARFKTSTVFFAGLWDGSLAFASTADILAKALQRTDTAWFGSYPSPFDSLSEGEYIQIMNGEIITESTVEWKKDYSYSGRSYHSATSGGQSAVGTANSGTGFSSAVSKGSEDTRPALVVVPKDDDDEDDPTLGDLPGGNLSQKDVVAMVFSNLTDADGITEEEYDQWMRTGFFDVPEQVEDPDMLDVEYEEVENPYAADVASTHAAYYTMGHDGDFLTYNSLASLVASLRWASQLTGSEELLVGPDEGDLRWVNFIADVGSMEKDGDQNSWVESQEEFQRFEYAVDPMVKEGIQKLRQLVGA